MVDKGQVRLTSANDRRAVAPLAGVVSPSMPVMVLRDSSSGAEAYAPLSEGGGCVLRFGCVKEEVIANLRHLGETTGPALDALLQQSGGVDVHDLIVSGLHMGDDCHHRFKATTMTLLLTLHERLRELGWPSEQGQRIIDAVALNDYFALNLVVGASKAAAVAAEGVQGSSLVTAIARNGIDTGIQVSGQAGVWFTGEVEPVEATYIEPNQPGDAQPDTGDSCIVEVNSLGACALPAAPALARWFGGSPEALIELSTKLYKITLGEHPTFTLPWLEFRGAPAGIDCERAVREGISPQTETLLVTSDRHPHPAAVGLSSVPSAALEAACRSLQDTDVVGADAQGH